jgi:hypothetical protein
VITKSRTAATAAAAKIRIERDISASLAPDWTTVDAGPSAAEAWAAMPCTPRETALLFVTERGGGDLRQQRTILMERFPSLTFMAATDLLETAVKIRDDGHRLGARVARGEVDREDALTVLAATWPDTKPEELERLVDDGFAGELR